MPIQVLAALSICLVGSDVASASVVMSTPVAVANINWYYLMHKGELLEYMECSRMTCIYIYN